MQFCKMKLFKGRIYNNRSELNATQIHLNWLGKRLLFIFKYEIDKVKGRKTWVKDMHILNVSVH